MAKAKGVTWDLSFLYSSVDDPKIRKDLKAAAELADKFVSEYRGKISSKDCNAAVLLKAIADMEKLYRRAAAPYHYASLKFSEDTQNPKHLSLVNDIRARFTDISNKLVFFNVELMKMPDKTADAILKDKSFDFYKFWLQEARKSKPFTLTEKEEQVINLKDSTGSAAFVQLYEEFTGAFSFMMTVDGKRKTMTEEEVESFFTSPDRKMRKKAYDSFYSVYEDKAKIITSILNTLIRDHYNEGKLRGWPGPMTPAYLRDQVTQETIDNLINVVVANYSQAERYYRVKAKMLKLKVLHGYDRSAPVGKDHKILWEDGRKMVVDAYTAFDGEVGKRAQMFFDKKWIDAETRAGKRGGAFCSGVMPDLNPVVLMSWMDKMSDAFTLAHELGHGLHDLYAAEKQGILTYHPPLVAAETASVFGEMLLTDKLLKEAKNAEMKRDILCRQLEGVFNTCSRQIMYIAFEKRIHEEGAQKSLSPEEICKMWEEEESKIYKDSIVFHPLQHYYWARIGHFFFARFYCFAYAFGKLFVLALYQRYLEDPKSFIPAYKEMLRAGGQMPPAELAAKLGMDITKPEFWAAGFRYVEKLLSELESVTK
ncbi:MAG: M3 family oligoendopeptidase [Candidatus Brocadiia bacterium]